MTDTECVEIEQLCRMEPSQAAIKIGKSLLKDILPKDPKERRSFLKTIRECRNVLGKGHEWGLLHASAERGHKLADESTSKELDIERDLWHLYILDNYKFRHYKSPISNPVFQIMIPNRNYKSVDDNSC